MASASSATYTWNPANDDWLSEAYSRIQIRGDQVTYDKIMEAERSANLLMVEWNNKGQNQFQLTTATIPLSSVTGVTTTGQVAGSYFGPATLQIFTSLVIVNYTPSNPLSGFSVPQIRLGRADYEQIPYKTNVGRPDRYFWDTSGLTVAGNFMQLWPIPDNAATYTLRTVSFQRMQDVGGLYNLAPVKYEWYEAFVTGLTAKLAEKFQPEAFESKTMLANAAWMQAVSGGRERGPTRFRVDPRSATSWR
jgi:hypothetical protein